MVRTPLNYEPAEMYAIGVRIPQKDAALNYESYRQALDVIRREPGVRMVAGADPSLPTSAGLPGPFATDYGPTCCRWRITEGLFETIGTPLLAGRVFTDAEMRGHAAVGILNESGARLVWPHLDPAQAVGRTLYFSDEPPRAVVGVVPDIRTTPDRRPEVGLYVPAMSDGFRLMEFAARMDPGVRPNLVEIRSRISERVAAPVAVFVTSASARVDASLRDPRFRAAVFVVLALVALTLAAVGLYAVASFDAALRQYELGVRLALGASAGDIERLVIGEALRPMAVGIGLGVIGAYWTVGLMQSFLYSVDGRAPGTFAFVVVVLAATGVMAAWIPARRAARLEPARVLKED